MTNLKAAEKHTNSKGKEIRVVSPMDMKPFRPKDLRQGRMAFVTFLIENFSSVQERPPPSSTKTIHLRHITIGPSHYCEKARWALDMAEEDPASPLYYTEDAHPSGFQTISTLECSSGEASVTPMIVYPDGSVLYKSDVILQKLLPSSMYPSELKGPIEEMEHELGIRLGANLRCHAYHYVLSEKNIAQRMISVSASAIERWAFGIFLDFGISQRIRRLLKVSKATADEAGQELKILFEELSNRLMSSNKDLNETYLMDTPTQSYGFTAVDLTFAALAYIYIRPPCMKPIYVVDDELLPLPCQRLMKELRDTPAGQHALRIYQDHRPKDPRDGLVHIRTAPRNHWPLTTHMVLTILVGGAALICSRILS